jgi:hypothetical protein
LAETSAAASGLALIAAATSAAVDFDAPAASVARKTSIRLPLTSTVSGRLGVGPWARNSVRTALPPSWPQALEVRVTDEVVTGTILNVKSPRSPA